MARSRFPNALQMRTLKYGEASDAERDAVAEALRQAGRRAEALLLYERRPGHPDLAGERDWARAEGNGFHLLGVQRAGGEVDEATWKACAAEAEARGRWMDARLCYRALGDEAALRRIAEHLPESLRPAAQDENGEP